MQGTRFILQDGRTHHQGLFLYDRRPFKVLRVDLGLILGSTCQMLPDEAPRATSVSRTSQPNKYMSVTL